MKFARPLLIGSLLLAMGGCASPANPADPYEAFNRPVYRFNRVVDDNLMKPVAEGYRAVTPQPLRTGVSNFFGNLRDVGSFANHVLQAKPEPALNDLMRVAINSTFGLFGLLDIATPAGLKNYKTGFGDTLATWGWKDSNYLVMPLLGPSTLRDGIGAGADMAALGALDPYVYPTHTQAAVGTGTYVVSRREGLLGVEETIDDAALDPYAYTRDAFMAYRAKQLGTTPAKPQGDGAGNEDDVSIDDLVGDTPDSSAPAASVPH